VNANGFSLHFSSPSKKSNHIRTTKMLSMRQCKKCSLDVSDIVRIKCAVCPDVELCVECFAEGVELEQHKKDHAYSVIVRRTLSYSDAL
jgi:hypothetical protein